MAARIKGQETEVVVIADGVPQTNLTDIKDSEFAFKMEIIQEGYLGQTTDKYDSVFKGVRGKMTLHFDNPDVFTMALKIKDKARRRTPGVKFNLKMTLNFPSGRRARVVIPDVEFGELPFNFSDRSQFVSHSIEFAASDAFALVS